MRIRIRKPRDVVVAVVIVSVVSCLLSELSVLLLYLQGGEGAFHLRNVVLLAGIVPLLISAPITAVVAQMSLALSRTQQQLKHLANTDPLTHLPNRRSFFSSAQRCLDQCSGRAESAALIVIDADHFKELNDSFGHAAGDKALVEIAEVLREHFRYTDLLCRVGGEEFAVLLPGLDLQTAQPLAQRIVKAVAARPITNDAAIIEYSISCGIADTLTNRDLPTLFKAADDAMYLAKQRGRNRVALQDVAA